MGQYIIPVSVNFLNLSGGTVTGDTNFTGNLSAITFYGDGSKLSGISIGGNFLNLSGGTVTGDTIFTGNLSSNVFSAQTFISGSTNLYDIFSSSNSIAIQPGTNITTGGSVNSPIINLIASPSVNNFTASGNTLLQDTFATSFTANTVIKTLNTIPGAVQAQFGPTIPFYITSNWPTLGFNAQYISGWKYGAGSSSNYAAYQTFDMRSGYGIMSYNISDSVGNAGNAANIRNVLNIYYTGTIQFPLGYSTGVIKADASGNLSSDGTIIPRLETFVKKSGDTMSGNLIISGSLNVTGVTTLAKLEIGAGDVTTPPIKLTAGALTTSPILGAIEFLTDDYFVGIEESGSGATRIESKYPTQNSTYVKSTTRFNDSFFPYFATDPSKSLLANWLDNAWASQNGVYTNQRFHIDLGDSVTIVKIYYENGHSSGAAVTYGVKDFTFWGSNSQTAFSQLTYSIDTDWTQITTSQSTFDIHTSSDSTDPKYITLTNSTSYRYYAFKFANNWANSGLIAIRRVELQQSVVDMIQTRKGVVLNDGNNLISNKFPVATTNGRLIDGVITQSGISAVTIDANFVVTNETSLQTISATTMYSGATNLYDVFVAKGYVFDGGTF